MKKAIILGLLFLTSCATPITTMRKGDSVVNCGGGTVGSALGGYAGYSIQKDNDRDCVNGYTERGYKVVAH